MCNKRLLTYSLTRSYDRDQDVGLTRGLITWCNDFGQVAYTNL